MMKHISYFVAWLAVVFGVSAFNDLAVTSTLAWYDGWNFPPLTAHFYLLIWVVGMLLCCIPLALAADSISSKQNQGGIPTPTRYVVINQAAASAVYVAVGFVGGYNKVLYFSPNFMCDVINRYSPDTVTDANRAVWLFILCVVHLLIFAAVALVFYYIERNKQIALLQKGLSE